MTPISVRTAVLIGLVLVSGVAWGDVVVVVNRTRDVVSFEWEGEGQTVRHTLRPHQVVPILTTSAAGHVKWNKKDFELESNALYFFRRLDNGKVDFQRLDFGLEKTQSRTPASKLAEIRKVKVVKVKLLVDDEEPATVKLWSQRLKKRLAAASEILEKQVSVKLEVIETGTWESSNDIRDFSASLKEFEQRVSPGQADVAIGFTSQYRPLERGGHLGSARGPLRPHVLVREWSPGLSESGRLEVLLHELGHFLGATHSPEPDSVMRPRLNDQQVNVREFRIQYDALNTMIMCLIVEEWKIRNIRNYTQISPPVKALLTQLYQILSEALPGDPASPRFQVLLNAKRRQPIHIAARQVLAAIVEAARKNHLRAPSATAKPRNPKRLTGDALTEYYVQQAAITARQLPENLQQAAVLLALGIGLDHSDTLQKNKLLGQLVGDIEVPVERQERLRVLGSPTIHGRRDLTQHYFISGFLTVVAGAQTARAAGVVKEVLDSMRGSGFSYDDLLADEAGVAVAVGVLTKQVTIQDLASYRISDYMPKPKTLKLSSAVKASEAIVIIRDTIKKLPPFSKDELAKEK